MALYAGPVNFANWEGHCRIGREWRYWPGFDSDVVGWLGTGDMHLEIRKRRDAFITYYQRVLNHVNVFGLPHHGSHRNFHSSLLGALSQARQYVAAAGANGYGHPSPMVRRVVETSGKDFIKVGSEIDSVLEWLHQS